MDGKKQGSGKKNNLNRWHDWLVAYVPKPIKNAISNAFSKAKSSILRWYDGAKTTLKDFLQKEANLMPQEH